MPNGKALRDCTGREVRELGNAFIRIADRVGDDNFVGQILDEETVRGLLG
jgi:hypothetical protein